MTHTLQIKAGDFVAALTEVSRVVEKRRTIPVLGCVLMRGHDGGLLELVGTDLDRESNIQVPFIGDGMFPASLIEPHKLLKVLRTFPGDDTLTVEHRPAVAAVPSTDDTPAQSAKPAGVIFRCDGTELEHVAGDDYDKLTVADFPQLAHGDVCGTAVFDCEALRDILDRVSIAISTEETRYYLRGVCFETARAKRHGMVAKLTATDGHCLMHGTVDYDGPDASALKVILPDKTVRELLKAAAKREGGVIVTWHQQIKRAKGSFYRSAWKVRFAMPGYQLTTKVIDGTFPDYERVIPRHFDKAVILNRQRFETALKRIASCRSERGLAARFTANGKLSLDCRGERVGVKARIDLDGEQVGDAFEIGFNTRYMQDILGSVRGDVRFDVGNLTDPFKVSGSESNVFGVLMPMRV